MLYYIIRRQKSMKKCAIAMTAILLWCSPLLSQDLVNAAKKEKERRETFKKSSITVVTNADLKKLEKEEGLVIISPSPPAQQSRDMTSPQTTPPRISPPRPGKANLDQTDQIDARGYDQSFATRVLDFNGLVRDPQQALKRPDGQFAEISILGILDLEVSAKNGPGDDIAIYARRMGTQKIMPGGEEGEGISSDQLAFGYWQGLWYGVLGMGERGEWIAIGQGSGIKSPEKFDLGSLPSIKKIRIFFKPNNNPEPAVKYPRGQVEESSYGIDAVEALHR
jgi:hypothetical protein